ncbi:MAG: metallophosphoesterase [Clostridia bacterium]|jgi:predicted MPP superfamily phosphohydrolase|nr:metallophosphoesterase [Clostridia bacterium]
MKKRKKKWYVIFLLILFLIIELVVSNKVITVRENVIKSSQIPASFNDFKILQISDLHSEEFGKANRRLLRAIDRQDPDIIAITGDMINRRERNYRVFDDMVAALAEKYPIYYIVGNHEQNLQEETLAEMLDHLENLGVQVLDNEKTSIEKEGEAINLYGLWFHLRYYRDLSNEYTEDYYFGKKQIKQILGEAEKEDFNILLTHNPVYFDTYSSWGADLTLSGHMHGGMVRIPFKGGLFSPEQELFPKYDGGVYKDGSNTMIVSRGLGRGRAGFRFFNRPELVVITLKSF